MDSKTRKMLIIVCVIGFVLTSTFTWGVFTYAVDVAQVVAEKGVDVAQKGVDVAQKGAGSARDVAAGGIKWTLAHANLFVPVFFIGAILWLAKQKTKG